MASSLPNGKATADPVPASSWSLKEVDIAVPVDGQWKVMAQLSFASHIPVIMLKAKADMQSRIEGLKKGAEVYLEKPFNKEELLVRIRKILEMRKHLQQYYLTTAGIEGPDGFPVSEEQPISSEIINDEEKEDAFVKKVREAIEQNLSDIHFTVEKLCKLIFMSTRNCIGNWMHSPAALPINLFV